RGTRSREDVLDRVAGDEHAGADAIRMERRGDLRRAAAPVVPGDGEAIEFQCVREVDDVLADGGLLGHPRRLWISEVRAAIAAEVRHEHAMAGARERRRHLVIRVHVIWKTVEKDDGEACGRTALDVADVERRCLNASLAGRLTQACRDRHAGDLHEFASGDHLSNSLRTTCPPFITNFTRSISVTSRSGSPVTAMTSAYLPFSRLPTRSDQP